MAHFRIELMGDTEGHIRWHFQADHEVNSDNDADRLGIISVINKLTAFNKQLETMAEV